jgi:hypothetical protein
LPPQGPPPHGPPQPLPGHHQASALKGAIAAAPAIVAAAKKRVVFFIDESPSGFEIEYCQLKAQYSAYSENYMSKIGIYFDPRQLIRNQ